MFPIARFPLDMQWSHIGAVGVLTFPHTREAGVHISVTNITSSQLTTVFKIGYHDPF